MSDLRTTIAKGLHYLYAEQLGSAVGWEVENPMTQDDFRRDADILIERLALRKEWLCMGRVSDERPVVLSGSPIIQHRHITEWNADD